MPENRNGIQDYQVSLMLQADVRRDCIACDGHEYLNAVYIGSIAAYPTR